MGLERPPARKDPPGYGVPLHIAHAPLGLALCSRPVRDAGPWPKAPVPSERQELGSPPCASVRHDRRRAPGRCR
jgi:hypothetical protein